ncbi:hypothetical protein GCM10009760_57440 [Kitasatospora kazusensis]|uniref:Uncharacterized protein n=1 Tax=Kitasatospora kazusensis TaxID=407974 RepID=A0ABP5M3G7_9ACTN
MIRLGDHWDRPDRGNAMVQVLFCGATRELELSGTRPGLLALGQLLRGQGGGCDLSDNRHPAPYERALSRIAFRETPGRDTASVVVEGQILSIQGGREALDLLADNIEGFARESDATHHLHVDYPTYDFITPESDPMVLAFTR